MAGGGLMQLIAFGAQDSFMSSYTHGHSTTFNSGKHKKHKFFYKTIKSKSWVESKNKEHYFNKNTQYQFTKPKPQLQKSVPEIKYNKIQLHQPNKQQTILQKANKHFGPVFIKNMNAHLKRKAITNEILDKYVVSLRQFNFSKKHEMLDKIRPVVTILRKQVHMKYSLEYFIWKNFYVGQIRKLGQNMENFTNSIQNLDRLLVLHQFLINQIDLTAPIVKPELKNKICPISLDVITDKYVECATCKICYDYSNESTCHWLSSNCKCAVCKQSFIPEVKNVHGENVLYNELKKNAKNT